MKLSEVVPWGRSRREYEAMFALAPCDVPKRLLGCGDGPASFNAEWTAAGGSVISIDPIYEFDGPSIARRFEESAPTIIFQASANAGSYVWRFHASPAELLESRRQSLQKFLADYDAGCQAGRYLNAALPALSFAARSFDLALCSHLLFLYSDLLDESFHVASVLELCRVAAEVRIFPLLTLQGQPSPHLTATLRAITGAGWNSEILLVPYEFQRGGNQMLKLTAPDALRPSGP